MKILLLGPNGQVGAALHAQLAGSHEVIAIGRAQLDLLRPELISTLVDAERPQLILNAAAYTAVDRAEDEPEVARRVNAEAPAELARVAENRGIGLIHFSTDYVYDGSARRPYREEDAARPLSVYGRTKLAGDRALLDSGAAYWILRTSWVYGLSGHNFLLTMMRLLRERDEVRVVDDQRGAPTWSRSIAAACARLVAKAQPDPAGYMAASAGVYHMSCAGEATWFDFACAIAERLRRPGVKLARLVPITTEDYPTAAERPAYSVLDGNALQRRFGLALPAWQTALDECLT